MNWTDNQISDLKVSWKTGASAAFIGKQFGVTRCAVLGKIYRLGLSKRPEGAPRPPKPLKRTRVSAARPRVVAVELKKPRPESAVTLFQLERHHCRFPIGDPQTPEFRFCGGQKVEGESYCSWHCRICFNPVSAPAKPFIEFRKSA